MILCLDVGNTTIFGGVFKDSTIQLRFRYATSNECSTDQLGLFLKNVLRENIIQPENITAICLSCVVPSLSNTIEQACQQYFNITPLQIKPGVKTGLKLLIKNPQELGSDIIANAIAATHHFPNRDIVIVDFGTATVLSAVSAKHEYLGSVIMAGIKVSLQALGESAAKLIDVAIEKPQHVLGKATEPTLQAGLYYGHLGAVKEILYQLKTEVFAGKELVVIATGGYADLYQQEELFILHIPDLVLHGLRLILSKNMT
ncbi:MAG: type III pantothenate kinase [Gammaproteobacteria bacterium]|nr:type III pantothenate kinase [Gammaproteobacteria bacterium]